MVRWEDASDKKVSNVPYDIDGGDSLSIVDLDPFNQQTPVCHQGQARSLDALDAGYDVR